MDAKEGFGLPIRSVSLAALFILLGLDGPLQGFSSGPSEELGHQSELTVVAVGDILLSRHVGKKIDLVGDPTLPFKNVSPWLVGADIAFGNLESPIAAGDVPLRRGVVFRCLTRYVPGLVSAGFDVLSTANNHALDQGSDSLEFTLDCLEAHGIIAVGTRKKEDQCSFGRLIEKKGVVVGFLAYSYAAYNDGGAREDAQVATLHDRERVLDEISGLKHKADVVFVSLHAGAEYRRKPEVQKMVFARAAIDAGADAIIGHHPHWIQPVEIYRGKPIFYSLGNFVFDQGDSVETSQGLMVEFRIRNKKLAGSRILPVALESFCCPTLADQETKRAILEKIGLDTDEIFLLRPEFSVGK